MQCHAFGNYATNSIITKRPDDVRYVFKNGEWVWSLSASNTVNHSNGAQRHFSDHPIMRCDPVCYLPLHICHTDMTWHGMTWSYQHRAIKTWTWMKQLTPIPVRIDSNWSANSLEPCSLCIAEWKFSPIVLKMSTCIAFIKKKSDNIGEWINE